MPTQWTEIEHTLGRAEAEARIRAFMEWMRGNSDLEGSWEGSTFTFTTTMQGAAFRGTIHVEEDSLRLKSEAPLFAPKFADFLPLLARTALVRRGPDPEPAPEPGAGSPAEADAAPTVLFLHIPKAGGTSLAEYITSQCSAREPGGAGGPDDGGIVAVQYGFFKDPDLQVPAFIRPKLRQPGLRAVIGHFTFGLHEHLARPWTYVTVLRDPVERVLSLYYFLKLQDRMSLEEFAANPPFKEVDNDQTRRIAGVDPEIGGCTAETLRTAQENLRRHFSVTGVIERLDETLVLLNRRLGWTREVGAHARNVTPDRRTAASLPPSTLEAIRGRNELDVELYRFATRWMDEAIAQEGAGFHRDLARLRARTSPGAG